MAGLNAKKADLETLQRPMAEIAESHSNKMRRPLAAAYH
jgi:hypothetical protein